MRLLTFDGSKKPSFAKDLNETSPPYAILSHTWGPDGEEVTFQDLKSRWRRKKKAGFTKIQFCGEQAQKAGLKHWWVDTCCIDKSNHSELSEAIASMFRWYRDATKCFVYLSDVSVDANSTSQDQWESDFRRSKWFTRGWTLQELLAPTSVEFFSREGTWLGDKLSLELQIHEITEIPILALRGTPLSHFSVNERMLWAAKRNTKKKEDEAYCLLGIFDVFLPLIYGEGQNAFSRLRKEIDLSTGGEPQTSTRTWTVIPFRRDRDFVERRILDTIVWKASGKAARVGVVGLGGVG